MNRLIISRTKSRLVILSPAKINLFLRVVDKDSQGYHNIETIFERIDLCDTIRMEKLVRDEIVINGDGPIGQENIIYKVIDKFKKEFHIDKGVKITLKKQIPIGAGMGGGSSNAACALFGFIKLWGIKVKSKDVFSLCSSLGSDICFFILGERFSLGFKRGNSLKPLKIKYKLFHVILFPGFSLPTKKIYQQYDKLKFALTYNHKNIKIMQKYLEEKQTYLFKDNTYNDLQLAAEKYYSPIKKVREQLNLITNEKFFLTGSGSAFYSIHSSEKEANRVYRLLKNISPIWKCFRVESL